MKQTRRMQAIKRIGENIVNLKKVYLLMAIVGAIVPYLFFGSFFMAEGFNVLLFAQGVFANGAAGGFTADLFISSFVFWAFMFSRQQSGPKPWAFIVVNLTIGLSCALPAYLWANERN